MRIVLATDGSASAAVAATLVENMRWPLGTSIDVVRVLADTGLNGIEGPWPMGVTVVSDPQAATVQDAEDALLRVVEPFRDLGLNTAHAVLRGRPADALLDWIDRHRPDLVVVGTRGNSVVTEALVGSVSAELIDRSQVPVLVARRPSLERVVVAVDGSEIASEAVATVRRWPFLAQTTIRTLSVAPEPGLDAVLAYDGIAAEAAATLRAVGVDARPEVRSGSPGPTVVAFAREWDADLVIMGSHGRTGVARLLLGSVARHVLHHSSCSVVVVRRHAEAVRGRRVEAFAIPWTLTSGH
jgi:nucleotide-binding universal stress UspA family protein